MPEELRIFLSMAALLAGHVVADFGLLIGRTRSTKAISSKVMGYHLFGHLIVQWAVLALLVSTAWYAMVLAFGLVLFHWGIDYSIWKLYRLKFLPEIGMARYWDDYWYWVFVGLEQCLHFLVIGGIACLTVL